MLTSRQQVVWLRDSPDNDAFGRRSGLEIDHIALIGNHLPRRCGIATYTTDVARALAGRFPQLRVDIWALNDAGKTYDYPEAVSGQIEQDDPRSYLAAAREITASGAKAVWIQHEFGIFGGRAGEYILTLIDRMTVPVAVAMHTVLANPDRDQRRVTLALVERCETIIVMADAARWMLIELYGADEDQVVVIPHGIPDRPFANSATMKARLGLAGRDVILTFGLLSPGKGIETMIAALPGIVQRNPRALYVVLGATHPHCIAAHGEAYRESLLALAGDLGVADHVCLINRFVEIEELLDYLTAADIYVTPYLNPDQVTSGTLAYAIGLGKPVVSTPYVHARELLGDGHGCLVDFGDSAGFVEAIGGLFADPEAMLALRRRAYALGREMVWPRLAEKSITRFERVAHGMARRPRPLRFAAIPRELGVAAIERICDETGMLQHSILDVPDRRHGYCIDDNARALILACRDPRLSGFWLPRFAGFVAHGWNPKAKRFRNFMRYDRSWVESAGSEDSCGRTVWALGVATRQAPEPAMRDWARGLYDRAIEPLATIRSPRAMAFMMLGTAEVVAVAPDESHAVRLLERWGDALVGHWSEYRRPGWNWFEPVLAYDNARLPEALIRAGQATGRDEFIARGLAGLTWLKDVQTTADGHFRPVGSDSFGRRYAPPLPFDQQPLEAWAMVDAAIAASDATGDAKWQGIARNAYLWFLGKNELGVPLGDIDSGECCDGLMPTGANRNRGAESILAFHLATIAIQPHRGGEC